MTLDNLLIDFRQTLGRLLRNRRVTALAVMTIALGIGPTTAIFSVVNGVVLRPLPFAQPQRLVCLWASSPEGNTQRLSTPDMHDLRKRAESFSGMAHYLYGTYEVKDEHLTEELATISVSVDTLTILGVKPALGRDFRPGEEMYDTEQVAMLSHDLWRRRFGGDPGVLGRTLEVRGVTHTIVGVLPKHFGMMPTIDGATERFQVWVPFQPRPTVPRNLGLVHVLARLKPGADIEQARTEVDTIAQLLETDHPASNKGRRFRLVPIQDQILGSLSGGLMLLLGAVGFVALIAVTNVANLQLAVGVGRRREIAIRLAVGASRARITRQLLLESLLIGLVGGAVGALAGAWGLRILLAMAPPGIPRLDEVGLDGRVLLFCATVSVLAGLAAGVAPALQHLRVQLRTSLDDRSVVTPAGRGSILTPELIVVGQIALAVVLSVGAGLMTRSFSNLISADPGFAVDRILAVRMRLPMEISGKEVLRQLEEKVEGLPGVEAFGTIGYPPLAHAGWEISYSADSDGPAVTPGEGHDSAVQTITPGYFQAMGIPLLKGQAFTYDDLGDRPTLAIVSQSLATEAWPGTSPLGREITPGIYNERTPLEVIGVVGDVRQGSPESPPKPTLYMAGIRQGSFSTYAVIRAEGDPSKLADAVRAAILEIEPRAAILEITSMYEMLLASVVRQRFVRTLLGVLSALAIALALVGIYGVMTCNAAARTREIGVRISLGATSRDIVRLQLLRSLRLTLAGVCLGILSALVLSRLLASLLFKTSTTDPSSFLVAALLLFGAALLACLPPALRAAHADPLVALRHD
jgi:putative ABC transport system permease protein